jgi:hypothetical protein
MANLDFNSEKDIYNILESEYEQVSPSSEYRSRLLQELKQAAIMTEPPRPLWRMTDWAIIAAIIILTIIAYGLWLPQHMVTKLFP